MTTEQIKQLPPLTDDLSDILGRPNFTLACIARKLHKLGLYDVPCKAEREQAAAIHFMVNLYLAHGDKWMEEGNRILNPPVAAPVQP